MNKMIIDYKTSDKTATYPHKQSKQTHSKHAKVRC